MENYKGIGYLRRKLSVKQARVRLRYQYYEMKNFTPDISNVTPEKYRWLNEVLGWCAKAVDSLSDRLVVRSFGGDELHMNDIYAENNADILFDSAQLGALIASCSFIYIYSDNGKPKMQVIDGYDATGIMDPTTGMLKEGYAVLERDPDSKQPTLEAYFVRGETWFYPAGEKEYMVPNNAAYPLLAPIVHRADATRPFGHPRISRACMSLVDGAKRTLREAEISAEFYSFPQRYILGMDQDVDLDSWRSTISSMLRIDKDQDGGHPVVGQFQQQSMTPFVEQMRLFAALFAGETGLTLDDLGFVSDNPSSAESIKASHESLRLTARRAQRSFGTGFINAGYLAASVRDNTPYIRNPMSSTFVIWEPIFEPDMSTLSLIGDGAIKINQAVPGYFGRDNLRNLTGIEASGEGVTEENVE